VAIPPRSATVPRTAPPPGLVVARHGEKAFGCRAPRPGRVPREAERAEEAPGRHSRRYGAGVGWRADGGGRADDARSAAASRCSRFCCRQAGLWVSRRDLGAVFALPGLPARFRDGLARGRLTRGGLFVLVMGTLGCPAQARPVVSRLWAPPDAPPAAQAVSPRMRHRDVVRRDAQRVFDDVLRQDTDHRESPSRRVALTGQENVALPRRLATRRHDS